MTQEDEKKKQSPRCSLIALLVVVLLLLLGYFVMRDAKAPTKIMGGKAWKARGGCGCMPPK